MWQVGPQRITSGNSTDPADMGRLWRDGGLGDRGNRIQKPIENDRLSPDECQALFASALNQAQASVMPGAVCYATVPSGLLLVSFIEAFYEGGFDFRHLLVWVKQCHRYERLPLPPRADPLRLALGWGALLRRGPEPDHHLRSQ